MKYTSFNEYLKEKFGEKVYKISINAGLTCPNRDGTLDTRGCIFCSQGGSGDFASCKNDSITDQINKGMSQVNKKFKGDKYIAYFQAFTNTYAPVNVLRKIYFEAINHDNIVAISIATRPDCLSEEILDLLNECNKIKPVFVELGLQTIHEETAKYIRRKYSLDKYDKACEDLHKISINVVTHLIIGLPNEDKQKMLESVKYVCERTDGIKLQLLHVLKNTDLEKEYNSNKFKALTLEEYTDIIVSAIKIIPSNIVIHRITGDGAKKDLIAPIWSANKKLVLNTINNAIRKEEL